MRFIKFAGYGTLNQVLNLANSAQAALFELKQFKSAAPFQIAQCPSADRADNICQTCRDRQFVEL
jgi:hypothetical protein